LPQDIPGATKLVEDLLLQKRRNGRLSMGQNALHHEQLAEGCPELLVACQCPKEPLFLAFGQFPVEELMELLETIRVSHGVLFSQL
jgi:hypothetical protein